MSETGSVDAEVLRLRNQVRELRVQLAVHHLRLTAAKGTSCGVCGGDVTLDGDLHDDIVAALTARGARQATPPAGSWKSAAGLHAALDRIPVVAGGVPPVSAVGGAGRRSGGPMVACVDAEDVADE